jgi:carbon storage regulator
MLVVTRKPGEALRIGNDIEVVVLEVGKGRIKLGFSGPRDVIVRRSELFERDQAKKSELQAATAGS